MKTRENDEALDPSKAIEKSGPEQRTAATFLT
jgi:hypothetical protein